MNIEQAIGVILNEEKSLESRLDLLTELSVVSTSESIFKACEMFRHLLCYPEKSHEWPDRVPCMDTNEQNSESVRTKESNEINEGE